MTDDTATATLDVDGLRTALHCPRRYEFAHVHGLAGSDDDAVADRVDVLRSAICDALRSGETDREALEAVASDRLSTLWTDHDEPFHSSTQRRHERRVLEATLSAYLDRVGTDHAAGIERLDADATRGELIGPALPLSSAVDVADGPHAAERVRIDATVDYVYGDGSSIVGVRFVPTLAPLGRLRYRSDWEATSPTASPITSTTGRPRSNRTPSARSSKPPWSSAGSAASATGSNSATEPVGTSRFPSPTARQRR